MAKLEFTVSLHGSIAECEKLAKTMQAGIERTWARANPRTPTTTLLIGKNEIRDAGSENR